MRSRFHLQLLAAAALMLLNANTAAATAADRGQEYYRRGEEAFRRGHLDEALGAFQRGYRLSRRPAFLLNIAQCYRAKGRPRQAITYLERFISEASDDPLRPAAVKTLRELRLSLEPAGPSRAAAASQPTVGPSFRRVTIPAEPAPTKGPSSSWKWWLVAGGAVVIGAVVTGIVLAASGDSEGSPALGTVRLPPPP